MLLKLSKTLDNHDERQLFYISDKLLLIQNYRHTKVIHRLSDRGKILLQDSFKYLSDYYTFGGRLTKVEKDRNAARHEASDIIRQHI